MTEKNIFVYNFFEQIFQILVYVWRQNCNTPWKSGITPAEGGGACYGGGLNENAVIRKRLQVQIALCKIST